eukprot:CAMPEP_0171295556 /NCGR_PEP_ID=MMETSP0816-20121228/4152_1 /TAXON_ID=420281 /ORGANISM="Proboscia inermis, Strain CCAP1064/1" /LENGTH=146 /DNA_ID=CAMNT_0011768291 /DNA_START=26 /DNA_END=466 /DNA_ORIENTATION=-
MSSSRDERGPSPQTPAANIARALTRRLQNRTSTVVEDVENVDAPPKWAWAFSFSAAMIPLVGFGVIHQKGLSARVLNSVAKSPVGVYGFFALPFVTLSMEKCIYDTVQAYQGINPNVRPKDRGGFPSGGAELPSFSLIPIQKRKWQ